MGDMYEGDRAQYGIVKVDAARLEYEAAEELLNKNTIESRWALARMVGAEIVQEGNQWCVIYGDLPTGVAGFGDTINEAVENFNKEFSKPAKVWRPGELYKGTEPAKVPAPAATATTPSEGSPAGVA